MGMKKALWYGKWAIVIGNTILDIVDADSADEALSALCRKGDAFAEYLCKNASVIAAHRINFDAGRRFEELQESEYQKWVRERNSYEWWYPVI